MRSVADELRQEERARQHALSPTERLTLSLELGDHAACLYADAHRVSIADARNALRRQRQLGRRRSACHDDSVS